MNGWGWLFFAPMIALMVLDPVYFIPAMIFCALWVLVWCLVFFKVIGRWTE